MKNIYLAQANHSSGNPTDADHGMWLPYSVACLWSYAKQFKDITDEWQLKELIYLRENIEPFVDRLDQPALIGFYSSVWNEQWCLAAAKAVKERYPECIMLFGGPQPTPDYPDKYEFVDSVCVTEGEAVFVEMLRTISKGEPLQKVYQGDRIKEVEHLPSPYLDGTMDHLFELYPDQGWSMGIETNRGCPYACTFCNWGLLTYSKVTKFDISRVVSEFYWADGKNIQIVFLTDANFGIFPERDLEIAREFKKCADRPESPFVLFFSSYAKNQNETIVEIMKLLEEYTDVGEGLKVSLQTRSPEALEAVKRKNMKVNKLNHIIALTQKEEIPVSTEMILGLPGETLEGWKNSLCMNMEMGSHKFTRVYPPIMLPNTEMADPEYREKYQIETVIAPMSSLDLHGNRFSDVVEYNEVVCSTKDMSKQELIEAWKYTWMVESLHYTGMAFVYSRYCNEILHISHREFWDSLYEFIKNDSVYLRKLYDEAEEQLQLFFDGKLAVSYTGVYERATHRVFYEKELIMPELETWIRNFIPDIDDGVIVFQNHYHWREIGVYPMKFFAPFKWSDINLLVDKDTSYYINERVKSRQIHKLSYLDWFGEKMKIQNNCNEIEIIASY